MAEHTEVLPWLKTLPLAPEYHPTLSEFEDPIAYIFKIEKEASQYGICKIVPPVASASKKTVVSSFNRSLSLRSPNSPPSFSTRQQQIGFCPRKHRPAHRPVWQSGNEYSLTQFEAKARSFERSYLKNKPKKPLELESLYWKASVDKPFSVEYANDMPGSAFSSLKKDGGGGGILTVGDTAWNMRGVSRAKGSLLRFMKEEIPGVTSPMVYVAMLFSWFAWHVEDHDLHSLNYLHMGAGKTWYGVPREGAVAFEEVVRVHGYGGEINPLVTFATLGEKTTVMSPEVLIGAGIPCCRLVQNAGEFVVTFPRAYHSGFSHGYNVGEAANIATPEWLRVAKDAAIRRASINCPPMVSHFQLLYDLALSLCSRIPTSISSEPRSSRLRDKKKGEGEALIKQMFVEDVMRNNDMLHALGDGTSIVLLPQSSLDDAAYPKSRVSSQLKGRLPVGLCSPEEEMKFSRRLAYGSPLLDKRIGLEQYLGPNPMKGKFSSVCDGNKVSLLSDSAKRCSLASLSIKPDSEIGRTALGDKTPDQGLFSCVTCGILNFACVAIVQPTETAANYLISATDCSIFNSQDAGPNVASNLLELSSPVGKWVNRDRANFVDVPTESADLIPSLNRKSRVVVSDSSTQKGPSSLGLLALTYGNSTDSDEEEVEADVPDYDSESRSSIEANDYHNSSLQAINSNMNDTHGTHQSFHSSSDFEADDIVFREPNSTASFEKISIPSAPRSDEDSSRSHIFCLHHAAEVVQQLNPIGGSHILLLCHPDYPELEAEAKSVAEEMGVDHHWNDIRFSEAAEEDEDRIQSALLSEEGLHGNGDWTVKLGINLFYTVNLSRSPLYSKQMAYNPIIYKAFGRSSQDDNSTETKVQLKGPGRQKKIVMVGKWCGKVWMSNQVHPLLADRETNEEERDFHAPRKSEVKCETVSKIACPAQSTCTIRKQVPATIRKCGSVSEIASATQSTPTIRKSERKRKSTLKCREMIEANKHPKTEDVIKATDDSGDEVDREPQRTVRSKKTKLESLNTVKTLDRNKRNLDTDEEMEDRRSTRFRTLTDDSEDEVDRRPRRTVRNKKMKLEAFSSVKAHSEKNLDTDDDEVEDGPSTCITASTDDDSEDEVDRQPQRSVRSKKMKLETFSPVKTLDHSRRNLDTNDDEMDGGPSTRLRRRILKPRKDIEVNIKPAAANPIMKKQKSNIKAKRIPAVKAPSIKDEEGEYVCDIEGCAMSFDSKQELIVHKRNICPVKGCGKKFFSHKYLVQHRRVHEDDRPLKCPWKGCKMAFKWAWARTEHIRVHTGARPYVCTEAGCGQTFRFVSDFSRHKRKTGHSAKGIKGR